MNPLFAKRKLALAVAAFVSTLPVTAPAAEKAANKAAGHYVTGDFHNHTTCSDGSLSLQKLVDKSAGTYGLDWFAQVGHGGASARNCTLAEDPFEPVAPALGLSVPPTYPSGGQPASDGAGPNQNWQDTLPQGANAIKGDVSMSGDARRMWKWQEIQEFIYPVLEAESRRRNKAIFVGLEQNAPGHEHVSTAIVDGQLPATGTGNANAMAQYEYCFDRSDSDTSRGASNQWDCAVPGSSNNGLLNETARKIIVASGTGSGSAGHVKSLEGIKWMAATHANSSFYVPAHLERAGVFNPNGNNGFNIEHLRNFNNLAPNIAFGFESQPGHQAEGNRGSYGTGAVGGGTYGGTGVYAATVGGVWDALLGEGRNWFFFASSDYHNRGSFGPDQLESTADFYPGEYTKDYVMVRNGQAAITPQAIVDGLRTGNSFVSNGDLIDRLSFVVCATNPGLVRQAGHALIETAAVTAAANNAEVRIDGCATMGEKLVVRPGADLLVSIVLRDPQGSNHSPYGFPNPSLAQVNINQPLNKPVLDHVDLISGNVTGYVSPNSANYAGLIGSAAASNPSAKVAKVFNASNWVSQGTDGTLKMAYRIPAVEVSQYVRLRGTNLPASTPFETDANGNPLLDFGSQGKIACGGACPNHMTTVDGVKMSSYDVAGWADLWFYSNPVFVEVRGGTPVAGIK